MPLWEQPGTITQGAIELDTMIYHGQPISLSSEVGALTLLYGALQSAIASVDDACDAERAYKTALVGLSSKR